VDRPLVGVELGICTGHDWVDGWAASTDEVTGHRGDQRRWPGERRQVAGGAQPAPPGAGFAGERVDGMPVHDAQGAQCHQDHCAGECNQAYQFTRKPSASADRAPSGNDVSIGLDEAKSEQRGEEFKRREHEDVRSTGPRNLFRGPPRIRCAEAEPEPEKSTPQHSRQRGHHGRPRANDCPLRCVERGRGGLRSTRTLRCARLATVRSLRY